MPRRGQSSPGLEDPARCADCLDHGLGYHNGYKERERERYIYICIYIYIYIYVYVGYIRFGVCRVWGIWGLGYIEDRVFAAVGCCVAPI